MQKPPILCHRGGSNEIKHNGDTKLGGDATKIKRGIKIDFLLTSPPYIPLSFEGEGEVLVLKGLRPFALPLINHLPSPYSVDKKLL